MQKRFPALLLSSSQTFWLLLLFVAVFSSCNSTKYLDKNQYLLSDYTIECDNNQLNMSEMEGYVKPKPNRKILGVRFYLGIYNLVDPAKEAVRAKKRQEKLEKINARRKRKGKPEKEKIFSVWQWLRDIGEAPVLYEDFAVKKNSEQLRLYLKNKGYYHARVSDSTKLLPEEKKASVYYTIKTGKPMRVRYILDTIADPEIDRIVSQVASASKLKENMILDVDILQQERDRITDTLKNKGYFLFSKQFIYFKADTLLGDSLNEPAHQADLVLGIKNPRNKDKHQKFHIDDIFVYTDYDPKKALQNIEEYMQNADTLRKDSVLFIFHDKLNLKPPVILQSSYLYKGDLFQAKKSKNTYQNFGALPIIKISNINFTRSQHSDSLLNCHIQITPATSQSYTFEIEGTNTSGNLGAAGNLIYHHKNLFRGAETFDLRLKGALESQSDVITEDQTNRLNTVEYGVEMRLRFPQLLVPFLSNRLRRRLAPTTRLSAAYNYQRRPDYTRIVTNGTFGYSWQSSEFTTHIFNPFQFSFVSLPATTPEFEDYIEELVIKDSYEDHVIGAINYTIVFNNQDIKKNRDHVYLRSRFESAGNLMQGISKLGGQEKVNGSYQLFQIPYAQYVNTDIDFRYYHVLNRRNELVYRLFAGVAYPYGNLKVMPFGKKYFSGGANSLRAWQVRALGPGSYMAPANVFSNQTADIKLEANIEYRFKMFWVIEGAAFLDAGNIWAINSTDDRPGALFEVNDFYKEIAIGTGVGLRFDFSFFIFRFDFGLKTRDPALPEGERWLLNEPITKDRWSFNIGIGYPF